MGGIVNDVHQTSGLYVYVILLDGHFVSILIMSRMRRQSNLFKLQIWKEGTPYQTGKISRIVQINFSIAEHTPESADIIIRNSHMTMRNCKIEICYVHAFTPPDATKRIMLLMYPFLHMFHAFISLCLAAIKEPADFVELIHMGNRRLTIWYGSVAAVAAQVSTVLKLLGNLLTQFPSNFR